MGNPIIPDRLQSFYDKSDAGRAGARHPVGGRQNVTVAVFEHVVVPVSHTL